MVVINLLVLLQLTAQSAAQMCLIPQHGHLIFLAKKIVETFTFMKAYYVTFHTPWYSTQLLEYNYVLLGLWHIYRAQGM